MIRSATAACATLAAAVGLTACGDPPARQFVTRSVPTFAITHVRVIDGTGSPSRLDQTIVVRDGRVAAVGDARTVAVPPGIDSIDGAGRTVIPGLVGMHEHLFYGPDNQMYESAAAFARLYLAAGVTTIRTAGAGDFAGELRLKRAVDDGRLPGPKIHITSPYLVARSSAPDPEGVAKAVSDYADRGATSFKAYTTLRSSELRAAIEAAHARGLRVTGHLCAVGFSEAAAMGIDNLEHGLLVDTDFYDAKQPDVCPDQSLSMGALMGIDPRTNGAVSRLIQDLVRHGVAITSTLAVFDSMSGDPAAFDPRMPAVLAPRVRRIYDRLLPRYSDRNGPWPRAMAPLLSTEMEFERLFVTAGGRLMAGVDPTGWGGIVAGFGDQRELELLVEAGLSPEAAIRVATLNAADFLYEGDRVGSIEPGRQADLVLLAGDPVRRMSDVRNVEIVFKDGIGYDSAALIAASAGTVGAYDITLVLRWPYNLIVLTLIFLTARRLTGGGNRGRRNQLPNSNPQLPNSSSQPATSNL